MRPVSWPFDDTRSTLAQQTPTKELRRKQWSFMKQLCYTVLILFGCHSLFGKTYYLPESMDHNFKNQIRIQNTSESEASVDLYIKTNGEPRVEIQTISVAPKEDLFIELSDYVEPSETSWIKPSLMSAGCLKISQVTASGDIELPNSLSNKWRLSLDDNSYGLKIQNHSHLENPILINYQDKDGNLLEEEKLILGAFELKTIKPRLDSSRVMIVSEYRSLAYASKSDGNYQYMEAVRTNRKPSASEGIRFLVAHINPSENKSFVVNITDPAQIELARKAINEPNNPNIPRKLNAKIIKGNQGYNFDVKSSLQANWSWRMEEIEITGHCLIDYDTNPQLIEEFLYKYENPGVRACPWQYSIIKELP